MGRRRRTEGNRKTEKKEERRITSRDWRRSWKGRKGEIRKGNLGSLYPDRRLLSRNSTLMIWGLYNKPSSVVLSSKEDPRFPDIF